MVRSTSSRVMREETGQIVYRAELKYCGVRFPALRSPAWLAVVASPAMSNVVWRMHGLRVRRKGRPARTPILLGENRIAILPRKETGRPENGGVTARHENNHLPYTFDLPDLNRLPFQCPAQAQLDQLDVRIVSESSSRIESAGARCFSASQPVL